MEHHGPDSQGDGKHADHAIHGAILPSDCAAAYKEGKKNKQNTNTITNFMSFSTTEIDLGFVLGTLKSTIKS